MLARVLQSEYIKNVIKLVTGSAAAQFIAIVSAPIVTRLYPPDQYGLAATFAAIVGIIGISATLRYDVAIVLGDDDEEASAIAGLSLAATLVVAGATVLLVVAADAVPSLASLQQLGRSVWLLPLAVATTGLNLVLNGLANRWREYALISHGRVFTAITGPLVYGTCWYFLGAHPIGLIMGSLAGVCAGIIVLGTGLRHRLAGLPWCTTAQWRACAVKYRRFPQFNLAMTFFDQLTSSLPVLLFANVFSSAYSAYFNLANNVLRLPIGLVGGAVAQVFYEKAARAKDSPVELRRILIANLRPLVLAALPIVLIMLVAGPQLFGLVFGAQWLPAGEFTRFLAFAAAINLVVAPISMLPTILDQQATHLAIAVVTFVMRILALWVGACWNSPYWSVALFCVADCLMSLVFLAWLFIHINRLIRRTQCQAIAPIPAEPRP